MFAELPSLPEVESASFQHYQDSADYFRRAADWLERTFIAARDAAQHPGGTEWQGQAQQADFEARQRDLERVSVGAIDPLRAGEKVCLAAFDQMTASRKTVLDAVQEVREAGFSVGPDYTVTYTSKVASKAEYQKRREEAKGHRNYIRHRVAAMIAHDRENAQKMDEALSGLETFAFDEPKAGPDDKIVGDDDGDNHGRPVDRTWKQDPAPDPHPSPSADDIRRVLEKLPQGNAPNIREVRSPQDLDNLWKWLEQNGVESPNRYGDPTKGVWNDLPNGVGVGRRNAAQSTEGPAIDVKIPGEKGNWKVHINPQRGGVPDIPAAASHGSAPVISAPPLPSVLDHPPVATFPPIEANHPPAAIPPGVVDHPPLPPWLQNPSPPGFHVSPNQPPVVAPSDLGGLLGAPGSPQDAPAMPAPDSMSPSVGPPVTIHMPPIQAPDVQLTPEQQRELEIGIGGAGILGLLLIGGLLVAA